tara:strand:+ start:66160 stop:67989 length:1830 start_codon:yes stop_codon:yes gene_type:complete
MMKNNKCYFLATILVMLIVISSCSEDYLVENPVSIQTTDAYYKTEQGYEDLIKSNYVLLRDIHQNRDLVLSGTDMFTNNLWSENNVGTAVNTYDTSFNSSLGSLETLWTLLYRQINRSNTAITRQGDVEDMDQDLLAIRVGEAKFLRAFSYFYLVQQWGDIPMPIEETTSVSREVVRVSSSTVYDQIITDLEAAAAVLPERGSTDYGRATKGAAQFLLARVHLTRGWNFNNSLGGTPADFEKAREYADLIINKYPLASKFEDLFPKHSENPLLETFPAQDDENAEIVFAVQFLNSVTNNWGDISNANRRDGNDYHSIFGGSGEEIPGSLGRTSDYNRHLPDYIVTPAMYRMFDPNIDRRYQHYFVDAQYALRDVAGFVPNPSNPNTTINITAGDTVLYFRPWDKPADLLDKGMDVGGTKPYAVINTDEIGNVALSPYHNKDTNPLMWKFWEPGIEYDNAKGTFDYALFRSAEAYLIAAEAILKGASSGSLGNAEAYYNTIVDRALETDSGATPLRALAPEDVSSLTTTSYRANGNLSIDMILDERARELLGEYCRWYDLKRTGKLIERTTLMNPETAKSSNLVEKHYLRPIPQSEVDRSNPTISNNTGF